MDVKEVIEFLKEWNKFKPYRNSAMNITQLNKTMDSVIDLLQQGEKYKKIVGEISNRRLFSEFKEVQRAIEDIKQKYFPKGGEKSK